MKYCKNYNRCPRIDQQRQSSQRDWGREPQQIRFSNIFHFTKFQISYKKDIWLEHCPCKKQSQHSTCTDQASKIFVKLPSSTNWFVFEKVHQKCETYLAKRGSDPSETHNTEKDPDTLTVLINSSELARCHLWMNSSCLYTGQGQTHKTFLSFGCRYLSWVIWWSLKRPIC